MEIERRKRTLPSPSERDEEERAKSKPRKEIEFEEFEGAQASQPSTSNKTDETFLSSSVEIATKVKPEKSKKTPTARQDLKNVANIDNIELRKRMYARHAKEMNFCFIKTKETSLKRGDLEEVNASIKQGKVRYVNSNSNYKESHCRGMWENGLIDIQFIEMKTVPIEFYQSVEYNGRYNNNNNKIWSFVFS